MIGDGNTDLQAEAGTFLLPALQARVDNLPDELAHGLVQWGYDGQHLNMGMVGKQYEHGDQEADIRENTFASTILVIVESS